MKKLLTGAIIMATAIVSAANAAELTAKELALVDMGAAIARGEQDKLAEAFKAGFAEGLTLDEAKEVVGQLYAYCGFPRALNAAATLMKMQDLAAKNAKDATEQPFVLGEKALEIGTANQTKLCGREVKGPLFDFHPQLDAYLKAHLFGDIFARDILDWRTREIVTIAALAARSETEPQMKAHIAIGKANGVTDAQAAEIVRRVQLPRNPANLPSDWSPIPVGEPNTAYAKYFIGNSYLNPLTDFENDPVFIANVTFEPGCRNNWHIHHASKDGGQILLCTDGEGWYQEEGKDAVSLKPGSVIVISANVKHWHGAKKDSWFSHLAVEVPGENTSNEWCEPVSEEEYEKL